MAPSPTPTYARSMLTSRSMAMRLRRGWSTLMVLSALAASWAGFVRWFRWRGTASAAAEAFVDLAPGKSIDTTTSLVNPVVAYDYSPSAAMTYATASDARTAATIGLVARWVIVAVLVGLIVAACTAPRRGWTPWVLRAAETTAISVSGLLLAVVCFALFAIQGVDIERERIAGDAPARLVGVLPLGPALVTAAALLQAASWWLRRLPGSGQGRGGVGQRPPLPAECTRGVENRQATPTGQPVDPGLACPARPRPRRRRGARH